MIRQNKYVLNINRKGIHKKGCWHLKQCNEENLFYVNEEDIKKYYISRKGKLHFCGDCFEEEDLYDIDKLVRE